VRLELGITVAAAAAHILMMPRTRRTNENSIGKATLTVKYGRKK
jgi:hypothetical protein